MSKGISGLMTVVGVIVLVAGVAMFIVGMGARIILCDPHRVVVTGPTELVGANLSSPDVRAGMSLLLATLTARGTSTIYNIRHIDRGYERVEEKLKALGACIDRQVA